MTRKKKFVLAGVAAATIGLAAAAGALAQRGHHWDGHHKGRHFGHGAGLGIMGLGFGGPNGRVCRGDGAEMTDHMLVRIEHRVKPTDDQKAAFDELKTAARAAVEKLRESCPKQVERAEGEKPQRRTAIERLAQTQVGLEASLEALKIYRPAAEKFYAGLTDEQKAKLDRRGGKRDGDRGHWKRRHAPDTDKDAAPAPDDKG